MKVSLAKSLAFPLFLIGVASSESTSRKLSSETSWAVVANRGSPGSVSFIPENIEITDGPSSKVLVVPINHGDTPLLG